MAAHSIKTAKSPLVHEAVAIGTIYTDEEIDMSIEIEYEYAKLTDLFGDFCFSVTVFGWKVLGTTTTPKEIIRDQVEQIIREKHQGLSTQFNY
jgi:hypothetical protein